MLTALDKLIEAVEAGNADKDDHYAAFPTAMKGEHYHAWSAFNGSLDAALALHEALLPGWIWDLGPETGAGQITACVTLLSDQTQQSCATTFRVAARAWLLAILRAYRSVQA